MPESSTAIRAAATEPAPARSVYRLDMSDRTPILMTLSEIWACAAPAANAATIARASRLLLKAFIRLFLLKTAIAKGLGLRRRGTRAASAFSHQVRNWQSCR